MLHIVCRWSNPTRTPSNERATKSTACWRKPDGMGVASCDVTGTEMQEPASHIGACHQAPGRTSQRITTVSINGSRGTHEAMPFQSHAVPRIPLHYARSITTPT